VKTGAMRSGRRVGSTGKTPARALPRRRSSPNVGVCLQADRIFANGAFTCALSANVVTPSRMREGRGALPFLRLVGLASIVVWIAASPAWASLADLLKEPQFNHLGGPGPPADDGLRR